MSRQGKLFFITILAIVSVLISPASAVEEKQVFYEEGDFKILATAAEAEKANAAVGGVRPKVGDKISVHYRGTFDSGDEFDSSYKRGRPFTFEVGASRVIKCWDEAFLQLAKGMKAQLKCPSEYAYGKGGAGRIIPPDTPLNFEVELVSINEEPPAPE